MEKATYIFTVTTSGDRTNIMTGFPLWDKEMFLENVKKGTNYGRYRYGVMGGHVWLLKDMSLIEFDQVFSPEEFTAKEITELFRKEISLKYGEHAEKAMKTAEEFFRQKLKEQSPFQEIVTLSQVLITAEQGMRWAHEYAKLKTEFHVTAALKVASEKGRIIDDPYSYTGNTGSEYPPDSILDKESILNAYPLENIK